MCSRSSGDSIHYSSDSNLANLSGMCTGLLFTRTAPPGLAWARVMEVAAADRVQTVMNFDSLRRQRTRIS